TFRTVYEKNTACFITRPNFGRGCAHDGGRRYFPGRFFELFRRNASDGKLELGSTGGGPQRAGGSRDDECLGRAGKRVADSSRFSGSRWGKQPEFRRVYRADRSGDFG